MAGGGIGEAIVIGGMVASLAGTGISFYGQQQAADNMAKVAAYNQQVQKQNADIDTAIAQQQARINQQVAEARFQVQQNNATTLDQEATATEARARMAVDRERQKGEAFMASQRAAIAKSGITFEGSPVAVMAETAGNLEQVNQDILQQGNLEARSYRLKAADERYQSNFSALDSHIAAYEGAAALTGQKIAYQQSQIGYDSALSDASGIRLSSYGTLLSGIGSVGYQYTNSPGFFGKAKTKSDQSKQGFTT